MTDQHTSYLVPYTPLQREIASRARRFMRDLAAETRYPNYQVNWDPDLGIEHWTCGCLTIQFRTDPEPELHITNALDKFHLNSVVGQRTVRALQECAHKTLDPVEREQQRLFLVTLHPRLVDFLVECASQNTNLQEGRVRCAMDVVDASLTVYLKPDPQPGDTHHDWRMRVVLGNWS